MSSAQTRLNMSEGYTEREREELSTFPWCSLHHSFIPLSTWSSWCIMMSGNYSKQSQHDGSSTHTAPLTAWWQHSYHTLTAADVQLSTVDKYTPLMIACQNRHEDIAALLLRSNADPNLQNHKNQTSLMLACRNQLTRIVSLLLSSGADSNLQNDFGWTALMFSVAVSSHELDDCIPVLLISAGANPNIQSKAGFTALMVAVCNNGSGEGILLNAQADVNAQGHHCRAALSHLTLTHSDYLRWRSGHESE